METTQSNTPDRQAWLSLLAKAPDGRVAVLFDASHRRPNFEWLRPPEVGSVMVQGRAGGTGAPFNLGEVTVTRCALTLATGEVGHAYRRGRSKKDTEIAALVDAMMQTKAASTIRRDVLDVLSVEEKQRRKARAGKAAATKVDFFTMVRGDD